ncbi:MAG TPA: aldehyde dehydrogenase family protein [Burkholderiaceae bacterium]|nr:aldehyde dehydrogenase family protein [Burkholderiaceae bacterium]
MLTVRNPANGAAITELPTDDAQSIATKYRAARAALPAWVALPLQERIDMLRRFREALTADVDRLASVLTSETGKPIRQAKNEISGLRTRIDFFLESTQPTIAVRDVHNADGMREQISHEPLGVIANISAWNYPYFVGGNVFVPALLTGNAVLYKPSEFAALTGIEIGKLLHRSGVSEAIFRVVIGDGAVGAELIKQPIDGVFFTGSYATGQRIARELGPRMVKLQLELGGKDPIYVRDDIDVPKAAAALADGAMYNTGQSCCSVERIYVHQAIYEDFVKAFVKEVEGFKIGEPAAETTYIGPITRAPQVDVLERQVADAVSKGAKLVIGGTRMQQPGNWFSPAVLTDVDHSMDVMREESFGPIIGIQKVTGDDEALHLMNDSEYGLTAGVYTNDEQRAKSILAQLRAGSVYWNCCDRVSPRLPWSGVGHSGVGLTLSTYGIEAFTRPKAWHLKSA